MAKSNANFKELIESILAEDEKSAREMLHKIVVETSRDIYRDLMNEEGLEPDQSGDFEDDIEADEAGLDANDEDDDFNFDFDAEPAADDEFAVDDAEDMDGDEFATDEVDELNVDDEVAGDELDLDADAPVDGDEFEDGASDETEDRLVDLETSLDELKAEFDKLLAAEEGEHEEDFNDDGVVREYVEKVAKPVNSESNVNAKSVVANKNDMGGTAKNIAQGGNETVPTGPAKSSNAYTKGEGKLGEKFENSPGANTKGYVKRASANGKEPAGVNTKSPLAK